MHLSHGIVLCGILLSTASAPTQAADAPPAKTVSTTIDFLDYCFSCTDPAVGYFTEAQYEEVIRSLAQAGFAKVYLRVDVCGKTLYPTTAGTQYAGDGREPGSTYLVNTIKHYDPAAKTVELGHKYGLQVWCWYAFLDDEATMVHYSPESDLGRRYGEYPLKDPFLVQNPHLQWRLDPQIEARQVAAAAAAAAAGPLTAIRVRSDIKRPARIRAEDVVLYTSADNAVYQRYEGSFTMTVESETPPVLRFDGLAIAAPYVQMVLRTPQPADNTFTLAGAPGQFVEVCYGGTWHPTVADYAAGDTPPEQTTFAFRTGGRFAWDYGRRRLGIAKAPAPLPRYYGVADLGHLEAREHKLAKLRELARYEFDGFAHSIRTHSQSREPGAYGYGEPGRDAYVKRYGVDIWREPFDRDQWLALRAEALNEYVREAVRLLAPRPLYMDAPKAESHYLTPYGGLPLQHEAWARVGGVAGIRRLGYAPDEALPPLAAAPGVKVVRFVDNANVPAPDIFQARLERWLDEPGLDEIEFYETVIYTDEPRYLTAVHAALAERRLLPAAALTSPPTDRVLTGWGGGKADEVVPKAAAVGFSELAVHHEDAANFARFIELGKQHDIGIYAWVYLGDLPAWRKAFPGVEPPLQVMSTAEQEALRRIQEDKTPGKSGYQFGGEPVNPLEVLETPLLCLHDPRVLEALQKQVDEILAIPGVRGLAFDYFGYQNYHCCLCPTSQALLTTYRAQHPELAPDAALQRFSLDTLVEFNNRLAAHAYAVRADAKVITHVYPVYLPEPLYGNRLDVDACGQTAAWFFEPFWSVEKITAYSRSIAREANRYHRRPHGAALLGYYNAPGKFPVKSPERLRIELQAILDGGCSRVQVCSFNDVLKTPEAAEVFRAFFGRPAAK